MNRDRLIIDHLGMAMRVAGRQIAVMPRRRALDGEDIRQEAYLGLCRAADRFDETRGVPFAGYAKPYIVGAVREALRCWSGGYAGNRGGAQPICEELDPLRPAADDVFGQVAARLTLEAIERLPLRERQALLRFSFAGITTRQIAAEQGVHQSRISQVLSSARRRLAVVA